MERYCHLHCELICPVCGTRFDDAQGEVRFFWGLLGEEYHLGDRIRWPSEQRGLLHRLERAIAGAPAVRGVQGLARVCVFDDDDDYSIWQCGNCHTEFDRPLIAIESDVIASVRLLVPAEVREEFGIDRGDHDALFFDSDASTWKPFNDPE